MKELVLYACEICGTQYSEREKCVQCEKHHRRCLTIQSARYLPYTQDGTGMPTTITVLSGKDRKPYIYKR